MMFPMWVSWKGKPSCLKVLSSCDPSVSEYIHTSVEVPALLLFLALALTSPAAWVPEIKPASTRRFSVCCCRVQNLAVCEAKPSPHRRQKNNHSFSWTTRGRHKVVREKRTVTTKRRPLGNLLLMAFTRSSRGAATNCMWHPKAHARAKTNTKK